MGERHVIDTPAAFSSAVSRLDQGVGPVAVDAERASGFRYSQRAYLIQMFRRGSGTFLFDPVALGSFAELNAVIAGSEWILHAATQDLTCLREVGLNPDHIFDTELAARLLGLPRVGLGAVVEELLGIHLAKEHSAADWSTRPLPDPWLEYAALDVEYLPDVRDALAAQLEAAHKTEIAKQEFADELVRPLATPRSEPWRRLSGVHTIRDPHIRAIARELWLSRDELARELDTAPGRLIPDASLVVAAKAKPSSRSDLAALRDFTGRASRSHLDRWWQAIERGLLSTDLPERLPTGADTLPAVRLWGSRRPEADARLKEARAAIAELSNALSMPVENILTPETVRRLAWSPPDPLTESTVAQELARHGARPWQIEATVCVLTQAFVDSGQNTSEPDPNVS